MSRARRVVEVVSSMEGNERRYVRMGSQYDIQCAGCAYGIEVTEGVGMMYSPHAVFYGRCDDPTQRWSVAFPDGMCEAGKPLLHTLVDEAPIREEALRLLAQGATPGDTYGHELYACPHCFRLYNRFFFRLESPSGRFEPAYRCSSCDAALQRATLAYGKDEHMRIVYREHAVEWRCPECGCGDVTRNGMAMVLWD